MNITPPKQKPITSPSESKPSVESVVPPISMPAAQPAVGGSTSLSAKSPEEFIIIVRSKRGTLHPMMNPKLGPGAMLTFEDMEQAIAFQQSTPVCLNNMSYILGIGGE